MTIDYNIGQGISTNTIETDFTDADNRKFPVAEVFGPTIQGEGRLSGVPCYFIRFGGCDYKCAWCDSMHAVDLEQVRALPRMDAHQILAAIKALPGYGKWVIFSGGNPALHNLGALCFMLKNAGFNIQMETQGSHYKEWMKHVDVITVSPKGPSAKLTISQSRNQLRHVTDFLELRKQSGTRAVDLKIPIFDQRDLEFAASIAMVFPKVQMYLSVGNNVGSDTKITLLAKYKWLINSALDFEQLDRARIHPQLHVLAFGNDKGH